MSEEKEVLIDETDLDTAEAGVYEVGFHIDGTLGGDEARRVFEEVRTALVKSGAEIIAEGVPRKVTLGYTISRMETGGRRDFDTASFAWIGFSTTGAARDAVAELLRADTRIVRFLIITTTAEAVRHAAEQLLIDEKVQNEVEGEESSDDLDAVIDEIVAEEVQ